MLDYTNQINQLNAEASEVTQQAALNQILRDLNMLELPSHLTFAKGWNGYIVSGTITIEELFKLDPAWILCGTEQYIASVLHEFHCVSHGKAIVRVCLVLKANFDEGDKTLLKQLGKIKYPFSEPSSSEYVSCDVTYPPF